jgi:hypothetical protein
MIRAVAVSMLAIAGFTVPAWAGSEASIDPAKSAAFAGELTNEATAKQIRLQLAHQGYVGISPFMRDMDGRWVGTAAKDGKTKIIAVILPRVMPQPLTN